MYDSKSAFNKPFNRSSDRDPCQTELPPRHGHKGIEGRHVVDPCCTWTETTKKWIHQFRKPIFLMIKEQKNKASLEKKMMFVSVAGSERNKKTKMNVFFKRKGKANGLRKGVALYIRKKNDDFTYAP